MNKKTIIIFGVFLSIVVLFLVLQRGNSKFRFFSKAQAESVKISVTLPSADTNTIHLQLELKSLSPGFVRVSSTFDPSQMQISSVENKSQLKKSGYTGDMIYSTPIKEANITGRYVLVVGAKPGTPIEGRLYDAIGLIHIKGRSGTQLGKKQMQENSFKVDVEDSQIVALDGTVIPFDVVYHTDDPQITQSDTRR